VSRLVNSPVTPSQDPTGGLWDFPLLATIEKAIGIPAARWGGRCHEISLAIVKSGLLGTPGENARVARGTCEGVISQHSWIVLGRDCWSPDLYLADPTLWHYAGGEPRVITGRNMNARHRPHGTGSIWEYGSPPSCSLEDAVWLERHEDLSDEAQEFLELCGPMNKRGWMTLANAPVQEWPAREILAAIADDTQLGPALIPVDVLGMLTDRNPGGLYW
jgi:hypothetical protein